MLHCSYVQHMAVPSLLGIIVPIYIIAQETLTQDLALPHLFGIILSVCV